MDTGLIHIYCGDGKGKTTASLGLTIRCAGRGGHVLFTQFLKDRPTGELTALAKFPNITVIRGSERTTYTNPPTNANRHDKTRPKPLKTHASTGVSKTHTKHHQPYPTNTNPTPQPRKQQPNNTTPHEKEHCIVSGHG